MFKNVPIVVRIALFSALALFVVACQGGDGAAELPEADGAALMEYVLETDPYTEWGTWPSDEWNDFDANLASGAPHGNVVRIYVNDIALEAADSFDGSLPEGSMIAKENYVGTDPANPGELDAVTIMYKVDGFNPDAGNWFWIKAKPSGEQIDAEEERDHGPHDCADEGRDDALVAHHPPHLPARHADRAQHGPCRGASWSLADVRRPARARGLHGCSSIRRCER
jgi:hypothetical protein